jgi:hypothetical protein
VGTPARTIDGNAPRVSTWARVQERLQFLTTAMQEIANRHPVR